MEEPDPGATLITFTAMAKEMESSTSAGNSKKEAKKSVGERLRMRKSIPRQIMKGLGKKRFGLSPSPDHQPVSKRTIGAESEVERRFEENHKRNLMDDLNKAAEVEEGKALPSVGNDEEESGDANETMESAGEASSIVLISEQGTPETPTVKIPEKGCLSSVQTRSPEKGYVLLENSEPTVGGVGSIPQVDKLGAQGVQTSVLADSKPFSQNKEEGKGGSESKGHGKSILELGGSTQNIPIVSCIDNSLHLDLMTAQPLINQFSSPLKSQHSFGNDVDMPLAGNSKPNADFENNFPPLNQGSTKFIAAKFEGMMQGSSAWNRKPSFVDTQVNPAGRGGVVIMEESNKEHGGCQQGGINSNSFKEPETTTVASIVVNGEPKVKPNEPFVLQPDKIAKIGCTGLSAGRPSLYFSGEDTTFLSEKMGHAIVGKFSHSIPSSSQVQKMLGNIKFLNDFTWNYINAKHIIIQFENMEDYAKMLNGPHGSPVWYIDHHPMRVFKWTPTFDSFFETPIAAVWCNVIAVPIHLFEVSALFAIGSLLGNPILLDHETASKKRLSFARICVEIDISKPPTEEIVLDILGKESVLKVKWDKIPLYCRECKHVGHSSRNCHAFGKRETPRERYNNPPYNPHQREYRVKQRTNNEGGGDNSRDEPGNEHVKANDLKKQQPQQRNKNPEQGHLNDPGSSSQPRSHSLADFLNEEGFIKQGRRGRKGKQGNHREGNLTRTNSADHVIMGGGNEEYLEREGRLFSATTETFKQRTPGESEQSRTVDRSLNRFAKSNPFQHLQHEEYCEDEFVEEIIMEEGSGSREKGEHPSKPPDKATLMAWSELEKDKTQGSEGSHTPNMA